jgi:hypothetical protein
MAAELQLQTAAIENIHKAFDACALAAERKAKIKGRKSNWQAIVKSRLSIAGGQTTPPLGGGAIQY